ncbi:MAG TPA: NAD(P)H-binding protein, partial [Hyphomicrobiales bacterium]|nr:NAD(P)H-binding protein [Hyphomicrobiales bacterium]
MSRPIVLTGATGFVGRRVLALAAEAGLPVRALARRAAALDPANSGVEVIEGDLLDDGAL